MEPPDPIELAFFITNVVTTIGMLIVGWKCLQIVWEAKRQQRSKVVIYFLIGVTIWAFSVAFLSGHWVAVEVMARRIPGIFQVTWIRVVAVTVYSIARVAPGIGIYIAWRSLSKRLIPPDKI